MLFLQQIICDMRRKIKNVFAKNDYNCFACSPTNPIGLRLQFYEEDEYIKSEWKPSELYEGYPGSIHGGIQAVLLDEIAAWTMYIKAKCSGVTSRMNIRYRKQVDSMQDMIILQGRLKEKRLNLCFIEAQLLNSQHEVCVEAEIIYFAFSAEKSISDGHFPANFEEFFQE